LHDPGERGALIGGGLNGDGAVKVLEAVAVADSVGTITGNAAGDAGARRATSASTTAALGENLAGSGEQGGSDNRDSDNRYGYAGKASCLVMYMPNHNGYCTVGTLYGEELTSDAQPLKGRLIAMKLSASLKRCPDTNPIYTGLLAAWGITQVLTRGAQKMRQ